MSQRVLVTRAPHQASALAEALRARGLEPILIPTIEIASPTTSAPLDAALASLPTFHWIIFTSTNAVESFFQRLAALKGTGFSPSGESGGLQAPESNPASRGASAPEGAKLTASLRIAAIGPATARALEPFGIKPTLVPPQAVAESLAAALTPYAKQPDGTATRFLIPRAEAARDILPEALTAAGADVTLAPVYRNIIPADSIPAIRELFSTSATYPKAVTFTSGSTVNNLIALLNAASLTLPPAPLRISIGPITSAVLRGHGLPPHAEADQPTIPALVEKVSAALLHIKS
ncbi:uroporphyrinogen-III synthase [Granulicella sp. 5B5]|uniref:uroporphyrinogen-III synthase n=1 Tax=Granulicella sp. 5B5 TaxID=1617967 RepID=UPI0015F4BA16|nr:uroporphyrinogen-III synthase [Granulicella sp. 5B5]QMV19950.1 uroporphyrinogen-III synthase [Granulicella sp. 5B5]